MGSINYGNQTISVQFFAAADAKVVNKRHLNMRSRGIWFGGYLSKITDSLVSISPLIVEIGDDEHQVRVQTTENVSISVSSLTPYIVLRWGYSESPNNYMDILALNSTQILNNDIIVGKCVYVGSTLTGFDYLERDSAYDFRLFLLVEPTVPESMYVRVRAGRVNYGVKNYDIVDQIVGPFTAPTTNKRIDVIYVDSDGVVKIFTGEESANPVAPNYNNKKVLAEITLSAGQTSISLENIKDVRSWL